MSTQSSLNTQSPIWQNNDIGPDSSFVYVNHTYDLVSNLEEFTSGLLKVDQETGCSTSIHGQWIKIKSNVAQSRKNAFILINALTNNSCKEIFLPSVEDAESSSNENDSRLSSPSPTPSVLLDDTQSTKKSTAQIITTPTTNPKSPRRLKSSLTRSITENQISSLQESETTSSSPFTSILNPFTPKFNCTKSKSNNQIPEEEVVNDLYPQVVSGADLNKCDTEAETKKRYSIDFLLLRSDIPSSKNLPGNWKNLNEKFPSICFCGKVLSYFNPYKYHEHWEKTKNQNYELHDSTESLRQLSNTFELDPNLIKAHTDDYLNLQTQFKDFRNSNYYPMNKFRNNNHDFQKPNYNYKQSNGYDANNNIVNGYKQRNYGALDQRQKYFQQKQFFYQQENQIKRRPKYNFNTQKVFE